MFELTPQERKVLIGFISICLIGAVLHIALVRNVRPFRWIKTSSQKIKKKLPNINTADAKALEKIDGIGPKTALAIIAYREKNGPYKSLGDLRKVKGITKKNLLKIKAYYIKDML